MIGKDQYYTRRGILRLVKTNNIDMQKTKLFFIGIFHLIMFLMGATIRLDMIKYPRLLMTIPKMMLVYLLFKISRLFN